MQLSVGVYVHKCVCTYKHVCLCTLNVCMSMHV